MSEESVDSSEQQQSQHAGYLLQADAALWAHIEHTRNNLHSLTSVTEQVKQIAMSVSLTHSTTVTSELTFFCFSPPSPSFLILSYVSTQMGGPWTSQQGNSFQYQLELAELQAACGSNIVPLGSIKKGTYQHRTLLFKVLADQLGISCSLQRGTYGRYWNTVVLTEGGHTREWVVDLVRQPGELLLESSQQAQQYKGV